MRSVVVTGATGFIGKYLVERLASRGDMRLLLLGTSLSKLQATFPHKPSASLAATDYSAASLAALLPAFAAGHPLAAVVHLAAKRLQKEEPGYAPYAGNVSATENLLQAAAAAQCGVFVFASTHGVYNAQQPLPFSEQLPPRPADGYALSKMACEQLAALHGVPTVALRLGQVLGVGEREGYMFATFLARLSQGQPITLWGKGGGGRDYIYVKDVCSAVERVLDTPAPAPGIYNVSGGQSVSFAQFATALADALGAPRSLIHYDTTKREDTTVRQLDTRRFAAAYGWRPAYTLHQAFADMKAILDAQSQANA